MAQGIDQTDRQILNVIQSAFPLTEEPFQAIGDQLSLPPDEVIDRIRAMKKIHVVRQISAIFDTRRLGYKTSLVAMRFPQKDLHKAALHINRHPGVSHNYERTGSFNLWFTIAVSPHHDLQAVVERMGQEEGAEAVRIMPTIRFFKIGVNFDMLTRKGASYDYFSPDGYGKDDSRALNDWNKVEPVTPLRNRGHSPASGGPGPYAQALRRHEPPPWDFKPATLCLRRRLQGARRHAPV